ncbi:hypothetical protein [Clostridium butyricum]
MKFNINNQSPADMLKDINNKKIDFGFMAYHEEISRYPEIESVLVRKGICSYSSEKSLSCK